jgi:DNA-binding CsgD family transcriptional regulator
MSAWNTEAVTRAFAEAAVDPSLWVRAMDTIASETGSVGAILLPLKGQLPNVPASETIGKATKIYFCDGWCRRDERFHGIGALERNGVADSFDFMTIEELERHPYFQEFLRAAGLRYFASVKMAAGDDFWAISIQRSLEQGPFSTSEKRELAALSPQISIAAALARALGFAAATAAVESFEVSGSAVALLDRHREVLRLTPAAEALLCDEMRIIDKRITSHDRLASAALDRALHTLLWAKRIPALPAPVVLPRRAKRPILAYPVRLSSVSANIFSDCQALLVFVDPERRAKPPEGALRSFFGLTVAEVRLAIHMASGEALATVADELRISKDTARAQLKAVFQKTGVHRQSELVALLASLSNPN